MADLLSDISFADLTEDDEKGLDDISFTDIEGSSETPPDPTNPEAGVGLEDVSFQELTSPEDDFQGVSISDLQTPSQQPTPRETSSSPAKSPPTSLSLSSEEKPVGIRPDIVTDSSEEKARPATTLFQDSVVRSMEKKPHMKDFALAWADGLMANLSFGPGSPEAVAATGRLKEIDKTTAGPLADKAAAIAAPIAALLFVGEGVRSIYSAYKVAESELGDLSPTVKGVKRGISKLLGGSEKVIDKWLKGEINQDAVLKGLNRHAKLNMEGTIKSLENLRELESLVLSESASLPALGASATPLGPVMSVKPPSMSPVALLTATPPPVTSPAVSTFLTKMVEPLKSEAGHIPIETIVPGIDTLENIDLALERNKGRISRAFTRFAELDSPTTQAFINISEGDIELREKAGQAAVEIFKGQDPDAWEAMYKHLQQPTRYSAPPGTEDTVTATQNLMKWSLKTLNARGMTSAKDISELNHAIDNDLPIPPRLKPKMNVPKWPDNELDALEERERVLQLRLSATGDPDAALNYRTELETISARRDSLENVSYMHQLSKKPEAKKAFDQISKTLSRKPKGLLGRKFATREEAHTAGFKTANLPTAVADTIYETNRSLMMDDFINHINRNEDFAQKQNIAPKDWVKIDERQFPSGRGKKYHPAIADAINELTYTSKVSDPGKLYDWVNTNAKIIGFYNPLFMSRFNVSQGVRAGGLKVLTKYPKALDLWKAKGDTYNYLRRNGLFNNVFDLKPTMEDVTHGLFESIDETKMPIEFRQVAKAALNPVVLAKDTWKMLNQGTWKIDEVQRMATWLAMKDKPRLKHFYSDFEIIELVNDFHANYGKVPQATRKAVNRAIFTPTYKISMARIMGRMIKESVVFEPKLLPNGKTVKVPKPGPLWPSLLRHYAMKLAFAAGLPLAANAYLKSKGINTRVDVNGYRLITKDPDEETETVYSLADPLFELTKILNRAYFRTIEFNLAAIPAAILNLIAGPVFRNKDDPKWVSTLNAFFKTGAPAVKELMLWKRDDLETYQKYMQGLGLAFIYKRNKKNLPERPFRETFLKSLDLWYDRNTMFPEGYLERRFVPEGKKLITVDESED